MGDDPERYLLPLMASPADQRAHLQHRYPWSLLARVRKRYKVTTDSHHNQPIADNLLRQDFTADRPNRRCSAP